MKEYILASILAEKTFMADEVIRKAVGEVIWWSQ
jgi:hypothetical protein